MVEEGSVLQAPLGWARIAYNLGFYGIDETDLRIDPVAANGILPDASTWALDLRCPNLRSLTAIGAAGDAAQAAYLDPKGQFGAGPAALVTRWDETLDNRYATLPLDLAPVTSDRDNPPAGDPNFSARTMLLKHLLDWFGETGSGDYTPVPEARQLGFRAAPNPFNPRTTIEFELPAAAEVALDIYRRAGAARAHAGRRDAGGRTARPGVERGAMTAGGRCRRACTSTASGPATSGGSGS